MAVAKVTLNGVTLMDTTDATADANKILNTYTAYIANGSKATGTSTAITPTGTKNISIAQNGTTTEDVTNYASAQITVNVPSSSLNMPMFTVDISTSPPTATCDTTFSLYDTPPSAIVKEVYGDGVTEDYYTTASCYFDGSTSTQHYYIVSDNGLPSFTILHWGNGVDEGVEISENIPSVTTLTATQNGTYTDSHERLYSSVTVNVPQPTGTISITQNGTHDVTNYASASVSVDNTFIVTLTHTNGEWVPDKTFSQIQAAYNRGDTIVVSAWEDEYNPCETSCMYSEEFEEFNYTVIWIDYNLDQIVHEEYFVAADDFGRTLLRYLEPQKTLVPKTITVNGTYDPWITDHASGYSQVTVNVPSSAPTLQTKTKSYTPSETAQTETVTAESGYDGLSSVEVSIGAISSTYVGTGITRRSSSDLTALGATVTAPAGYYAAAATTSVASGSASTPASTITVTPSISVNSSGLITATASGSKNITPTVSAGYVTSGTAGKIAVDGSNTSQLSTQAGTIITPSQTLQTAVAAGKYTTGAVNVAAIPNDYIGSGITQRDSDDLTASGATVTVPAGYYSTAASKSVASGTAGTPTASKGTVSNHSISVTPSVTNTTGYITGSTKTGTAVTVTASELASGNKAIVDNGTNIDVVGYSTVSVAVPFSTIYTGSTDPSSSQGVNGDIYIKTS